MMTRYSFGRAVFACVNVLQMYDVCLTGGDVLEVQGVICAAYGGVAV